MNNKKTIQEIIIMADGDAPSDYENQQSLVKYDNPVLVVKHPEKPSTDAKVFDSCLHVNIIHNKTSKFFFF